MSWTYSAATGYVIQTECVFCYGNISLPAIDDEGVLAVRVVPAGVVIWCDLGTAETREWAHDRCAADHRELDAEGRFAQFLCAQRAVTETLARGIPA